MAYDPTKQGAKCHLCPLKDQIPVQGEVKRGARLTVIGEGPGVDEVEQGRPFVGASGQLLERGGDFEGFHRSDLNINNALACWCPQNISKGDLNKAIECCRPRLVEDLKKSPTPYILALGKISTYALTGKLGVMKWMGGPLEVLPSLPPATVIPALHPAFVLRDDGRRWLPVYFRHVQRAWGLASGSIKPWKWPDHEIEPGKSMVDMLKAMLAGKRPVAFDVETQGMDPQRDPIMCVGLATTECGVSIPWRPYSNKKYGNIPGLESYPYGDVIRRLVRRILSQHRSKTGHNGAYDLVSFEGEGIDVDTHELFDTLLADATIDPPRKHGLDTVACIYLHAEKWKTLFRALKDEKGAAKFVSADPQALRLYNCKDGMATALIREHQEEELSVVHRGWELFRQKLRLSSIAMDMRRRGVPIDLSKFKTHLVNLRAFRRLPLREMRKTYFVLEATERKISPQRVGKLLKDGAEKRPVTGKPPFAYASIKLGIPVFNPRSKIMTKHLFKTLLKAPELAWSEKTHEPSYNDKVLTQFLGSPDPLISRSAANTLRFRSWDKLIGFLVNKNINGVPIVEGIANTDWKIHGTRTGRWSSPMMIIPKPGEITLGKRKVKTPGLRDIFVGHHGNWLVEADYKQLEGIIIALMAGDERWLEAQATGGDIHMDTARIIFHRGDKFAEPSKPQRKVAKTVNYAVLYGIAVDTLWENLQTLGYRCSMNDAERILRDVMKEHLPIKRHLEKRLADAYKNDYVEEPLSGLRYYFYGKVKPNEVYNNPVQMFGATLINRAIEGVRRDLRWGKEGILFQYHDALILDGPDPKRLANILTKHMVQTIKLGEYETTFSIDLKTGRDWGNLEDYIPNSYRTLALV